LRVGANFMVFLLLLFTCCTFAVVEVIDVVCCMVTVFVFCLLLLITALVELEMWESLIILDFAALVTPPFNLVCIGPPVSLAGRVSVTMARELIVVDYIPDHNPSPTRTQEEAILIILITRNNSEINLV